MGSSMLDFSAYNALLYSNGQSTSYYGPDDAYLGGGDPGFSALPGRRNAHHHHHMSHHQHGHPQQHARHQSGQGVNNTSNNGGANNVHHEISNRYIVYDRNSLPRLDAEKSFLERRKTQIANFGHTWLKPPGVSKTLFQIREECREHEEQAEAERREALQQQLVEAEAAALEAEGAEDVEGITAGDPSGVTDLGASDAGDAANVDTDMVEEEAEQDLDNDIPDADGEDFSFGNNDEDGDDPFASSSEEDDEDDEEDEEGGDDGSNDGPGGGPGRDRPGAAMSGRPSRGAEDDGDDDDDDDDDDGQGSHYTLRGPPRQNVFDPIRGHGGNAYPAAASATATPVRTIEEQREQARMRAAERREMRQMRATEDRMRALRAQPRLSGMGMYGQEDELDEEDEAQMLQEDDLVHEINSQYNHREQQRHRQQQQMPGSGGSVSRGDRMGHVMRNSLGDGDDNNMPMHYPLQDDDGGYGGTFGGDDDLEMDMDADLDGDVPEGSSALEFGANGDGDGDAGMDLSAFEGGYEHTDSEAELSSSVMGDRRAGGGGLEGIGSDGAHNDRSGHNVELPPQQHGFLAAAHTMGTLGGSSASSAAAAAAAAPRSSGGGRRRLRNSTARSEHNSLDISGLLSWDGSSNVGSSPHVRRL